jgi:hypothetical protein
MPTKHRAGRNEQRDPPRAAAVAPALRSPRDQPTTAEDVRPAGATPPADAATPKSPPLWKHPTAPAKQASQGDGRRPDTPAVGPRASILLVASDLPNRNSKSRPPAEFPAPTRRVDGPDHLRNGSGADTLRSNDHRVDRQICLLAAGPRPLDRTRSRSRVRHGRSWRSNGLRFAPGHACLVAIAWNICFGCQCVSSSILTTP